MSKSIHITEAEWEVMTVVWKSEPAAATAIVEELVDTRGWTLGTVRTLLRRLVNKGILGQRMEGKRFLYTARVSMEECAKQASETLWDRVLGRAPSATLLNLVRKANLSKNDIQELRQILRSKESDQ